MDTEDLSQNKDVFTRLVIDGFSRGDLTVVEAVVSEELRWGGTAGLVASITQISGHQPGRAGMRKVIESLRSTFPDFQLSIQHLVAEGDMVIGHMFATGTHEGPYQGLAATHRRFLVEDVMAFRIRGGQVVEFWHVPDKQGIMQQLQETA